MRVNQVTFENFKGFKNKQTLEIKPITILIGKNSSGKSSIAKLFTMLQNSFSNKLIDPLLLNNSGVEIGGEFLDLVYNRQPNVPIEFTLMMGDKSEILVKVVQDSSSYEIIILSWKLTSTTINLEINYSPDKGYIDVSGNSYKFHGFVPNCINIPNLFTFDFQFEVDYIGPYRITPKRIFYTSGESEFESMGIFGENAYSLLAVSKIMKKQLHVDVGEWFKNNFDSWELIIEDKYRPYIEIRLVNNNTSVNLVDVGQGMNQVLPVVVRSFIEKKDSIIIIEQPEIHLHPAAHASLGELFVKSALQNNQYFFIETHSENILLRIRKLIVENKYGLKHSDVLIYWVDSNDQDGAFLDKIEINEKGELSTWPTGVFSENAQEIIDIQKAIKK